jgi:carboxypeptidase C (cathepsin A)
LVFWYQGGPGCSGLGALFTEHGPFTPAKDGSGLVATDIAWTKIANVVYLEQPAFVGFSYSNTSSDTNTGDVQATKDNVAFVQGFLDLYPDYAGRNTWFTGESYGGFYVPSLAAALLDMPGTQIYKQLQGIMVGNPVFFCGTMGNNTVQLNLYYWHGLVSYTNYNAWSANGCVANQGQQACVDIWNNVQKEIGVIDQELKKKKKSVRFQVPQQPSLDPDCLYQDFCTGNGTLSYVSTVPVGCVAVGDLTANYLNRRDVQQAIHAEGPNGGLPLQWSECTSRINYNIVGASMVPHYAKFQSQKAGFKVLVYSGDIDIATVPFAYTQPCLAELQATNTKTWGPWFVNGQTAGYWEQFSPVYTFATLKGAGHEAPEYQPLSSFNMFERFMNSQDLKDPSGNRPVFPKHAETQGDVLRNMFKKAGKR